MNGEGVGVILETPTQALIGERDRARETAARLEEELAGLRESVGNFADWLESLGPRSVYTTSEVARDFRVWADGFGDMS